MEPAYFQCYEACAKCCPQDPADNFAVPLTLDEVVKLYRIEDKSVELFAHENVRWQFIGDEDKGGLSWSPVLLPCPYLDDNKCEIYDDRMEACSLSPENLMLADHGALPRYARRCAVGKKVDPERAEIVMERNKVWQSALEETRAYFGDVEVDLSIVTLRNYMGMVGDVVTANVLEVIQEWGMYVSQFDGMEKLLKETKRDLTEKVVELIKERTG